MKVSCLRPLTAAAFALAVATNASATPVLLSFSGFHSSETAAGAPLNQASWLLDAAATLSGSVIYDSDVAASGTSNIAGFLNPFTLFAGAFTDLNLNVDGHAVSSALGTGVLGNNVLLGGAIPTDIFLSYSGPLIPGNTFSGFAKDGWTLIDANFAFNPVNPATYSNSLDLPEASNFINYPFRGMNFDFTNAAGQTRTASFQFSSITQSAVSVPEPTSLSLLAAGALGLLWRRRTAK